jgi:hypothetical protein
MPDFTELFKKLLDFETSINADKSDINELLDLKKSIENDINSENIEFLSSLSESAKEILETLSDKVHEEAAKMLS